MEELRTLACPFCKGIYYSALKKRYDLAFELAWMCKKTSIIDMHNLINLIAEQRKKVRITERSTLNNLKALLVRKLKIWFPEKVYYEVTRNGANGQKFLQAFLEINGIIIPSRHCLLIE